MGGLKDAGKIVGAGLAEMFGDKTQISTINAANMLSYTGDANLGIAKDIWDENINVEYRELTDDNGLYTHSTNTITLSSSLIGGGKEESAKLATVMAHEGSHANGVNVEALAHANGLQTYSAINTMFGLNGDKNFSNQMLAGILAPENWKENTGDVEHWAVNKKGNLYWDGQFDLVDENGNLLEKANSKSLYASYAQFKGISVEEAKKLFESDELNVSFREGKLLSYNPETGKFDIDRTNDSSFEFETSDKFKASYDFQVNYADKVGTKYVNMQSAFENYQTDMVLGNNLSSSLGMYLQTDSYLEQLIGFNNYSASYDSYMQTYYSDEKNTLYTSKEATSYLENIKKDVAAQNVTNDSKGYDGFGPDGVLNPVDNENTTISTRAIYVSGNNAGKTHLFGEPKGFSVDIAKSTKESILGSKIYINTNSWLYGDSVFDNPTGTSYGSEVRLYGINSTYIYGHMQEDSISRTALKNLAKKTTSNSLWRSYLPAGTQIGNLGNTGNSSGPHLHWEYRKGYQK